jgi:predicted metal-dependent peptidase
MASNTNQVVPVLPNSSGKQFTPTLDKVNRADIHEMWASSEPEQPEWVRNLARYHQRLYDARNHLLMNFSFMGNLAMQLRFVVSDQVETAAIRADGVVFFSPHFIDKLDIRELAFLICHELCHLGYGHFERAQGKDHMLWNVATDYRINDFLIESARSMHESEVARLRTSGHDTTRSRPPIAMPTGDSAGLLDPQYRDDSDEQIYIKILKDARQQQKQQGGGQQGQQQGGGQQGQQQGGGQQGQQQGGGQQGQQQGGGQQGQQQGGGQQGQQQGGGQQGQRGGWGTSLGDCDFAATEPLKREAQDRHKVEKGEAIRVKTGEEWKRIFIAAAQAHERIHGSLPAGISRMIEDLREPPVLPWDKILSKHANSVLLRDDERSYKDLDQQTYAMMNTPGLPSGIFPVIAGQDEDLSEIVLAFDTSGSMTDDDLQDNLREAVGVLKRYKGRRLRVMSCDAAVQFDKYVRRVDEIDFKGGGGTRSAPVFERIRDSRGLARKPALVVYFTDLEMPFPDKAPKYHVIWVYTGHRPNPPKPPFGEVITLQSPRDKQRGRYGAVPMPSAATPTKALPKRTR